MRRLCGWTLVWLVAFVLASGGWEPAPAQQCAGDCNGSGEVTIDELVSAVNILLERFEVGRCAAADFDSNGRITVDELVRAVNAVLNGCAPSPTPTRSSTGTTTPTTTPTTALATATSTLSASASVTPTGAAVTATVSPTRTSTSSRTATRSATSRPSTTVTPTASAGETRTPTRSATATGTASPTTPSTPTPTVEPTGTPTGGALGTRRFSLEPSNSAVISLLPGDIELVRSGFAGYLDLTAGAPDAAGRATINVTGSSQYLAFEDEFGAVCIRPLVPAANAGLIDCDGDSEFGRMATQDHHLGQVGVDGFTEDDCTAAGGTVESASLPHSGVCNGPIAVAPLSMVDAGPGAVLIGPAPPLNIVGLPVELAFEAALPCGDEGPGAMEQFALISGPSRTQITDVNNADGQSFVYENPGENFSCPAWAQENGAGRLLLAVPSLHGAGATDVITLFVFDD